MKAYVLINTVTGKADEVMEDITTVVTVNSIKHVWGAYDIIVEMEDIDKDSVNRSIINLRKISSIRSTLVLFDAGI